VCCPVPEPGPHWRTRPFSRFVASDGMRVPRGFEAAEGDTDVPLSSLVPWRQSLDTCVVQTRSVCAIIGKSSQDTRLNADCAGTNPAENSKTSAPRDRLSLDHGGPAKELFLRREGDIGVPAGVWTNP